MKDARNSNYLNLLPTKAKMSAPLECSIHILRALKAIVGSDLVHSTWIEVKLQDKLIGLTTLSDCWQWRQNQQTFSALPSDLTFWSLLVHQAALYCRALIPVPQPCQQSTWTVLEIVLLSPSFEAFSCYTKHHISIKASLVGPWSLYRNPLNKQLWTVVEIVLLSPSSLGWP